MERMLKYFFLAGHVQYARYLTQYLLEMRVLPAEAKADLVSGAFVCRHQEGYWNGVSGDHFGERTAIKIGKGALKGMTLSPDLVSVWIDAFPITVHVSDRMDYIYSADAPGQTSQKQHREELKHRRVLDADDWARIDVEVAKYPHPLEDSRPHLYNPVSGKIAPAEVNVADSVSVGEIMERKYTDSLPDGFYNPISSPIKTMDCLKKQGKDLKGMPIIDIENIFLRLLLIGQRRQMELGPLFAYELCSVPPSLIYEHGCLGKGNKSALTKRLGVVEPVPSAPEIVIVDAQQLLYRIVWPHGGKASDLIASIKTRLRHYSNDTEKIIVFDKYQDVSAKEHERIRRACEITINYKLSICSQLTKRDAVMNNKSSKRRLSLLLSTCSIDNVAMDTHNDGDFGHDEADITMISYVLQTAKSGKHVIRILSDDTDVFILLIYWVYRKEIGCKVQMERYDGTVLDINATCNKLGPKCLELLSMHALSGCGCDTTSYPYAKGKVTALNTLLAGNFPGLADKLGEVDVTLPELIEAATPFFIAMYGQSPGTAMESARFTLFTTKKKNPKVKALPPTSANLSLHVQRAHLQVMLWKAADKQSPPQQAADITQFGWEIQDGVSVPVMAKGDTAPPLLSDVIRCQCRVHAKKCSTVVCSCHKERLSCISYYKCEGNQGFCNPYTNRESVVARYRANKIVKIS